LRGAVVVAHLLQLLHGLWMRVAALQEPEDGAKADALDRLEVIRSEIETELSTLSS
jgi:hypothetical protein